MNTEQLYQIFLAHSEITTDSRNCPKDSIFFALKGANFDGNKFAETALEQGCAYAVVDEAEFACNDRCILVNNVLESLQELAKLHRKNFKGPVLQITGTNGKTTTKELISSVLSKKYRTLYTQGNLNNHIGVPLTLLKIKLEEHQIAVIESGANHPGEIAFLSDIIQPTCGIITNVGIAHLEGFGSFEGVIQTKGELYDYLRKKRDSFIFLHADNPHLHQISHGLKTIEYGMPGKESLALIEGIAVECSPFLAMKWRKRGESSWHNVQTKLIGEYNIVNTLAAACVGTKFDIPENLIDEALTEYTPTNDRSEYRKTENNHLIVDAYNANPSSMAVALKNFNHITGKHKMVILGDMRELGESSQEEHQKIIDLLNQQRDLEEVWLVGSNFSSVQSSFRLFNNVEEVISTLNTKPIKEKLILIKGSNGTQLYKLPKYL